MSAPLEFPCIGLEPADAANAQKLKSYRDKVAELTGVRQPEHDSYEFHISIAYPLIKLNESETSLLKTTLSNIHEHFLAEFEPFHLESPQLSFFDDIYVFVTQAKLHHLQSRSVT